MPNGAQVIIGGPDGSFDLVFPLTTSVVYYASVILVPEVRSRSSVIALLHADMYADKHLPPCRRRHRGLTQRER